MTNDKHDSKDSDLERQLHFILAVFGRKQEPGEPPLESLPPSQRLVPNAPLTEAERRVLFWAETRFHEAKSAPKDDSVPQSVQAVRSEEPPQRTIPKPRQKTLTQLLQENGIPDAPPDDPIYRKPYSIRLVQPSVKPTQGPEQPSSGGTGAGQEMSPHKLIDSKSTDPEERSKYIYHLGMMLSTFRAPTPYLLPRIRSAVWLASKEGIDWRDLYRFAKSGLPSHYPQPPSEDLVDPEREGEPGLSPTTFCACKEGSTS
jgi:hypothetical protein